MGKLLFIYLIRLIYLIRSSQVITQFQHVICIFPVTYFFISRNNPFENHLKLPLTVLPIVEAILLLSGRVLCTNFCAFLQQFSASLCAPLQLHLHLRRCSCLIIENAKNAKSLNFPARLTYGQAAAEQSAEQAAHSQSLCLQLAHIYRLSCCCCRLLFVVDSSWSSSCFDLFRRFVVHFVHTATIQLCICSLALFAFFTAHSKKKCIKNLQFTIFVAHNTRRERERTNE